MELGVLEAPHTVFRSCRSSFPSIPTQFWTLRSPQRIFCWERKRAFEIKNMQCYCSTTQYVPWLSLSGLWNGFVCMLLYPQGKSKTEIQIYKINTYTKGSRHLKFQWLLSYFCSILSECTLHLQRGILGLGSNLIYTCLGFGLIELNEAYFWEYMLKAAQWGCYPEHK